MPFLVHSGLFRRRECTVPTARGWILLAGLVLGLAALLICFANSFLSVNEPVSADLLVVESWLPDFALIKAAHEFKHGGYKYAVTTGGDLADEGVLSRYKTGAELAAAKLVELGLNADCVVSVPSPNPARDRTYSSAAALRTWLKSNHTTARSINVYSLGPHARRSRLLFQRALGADVRVGIFACPEVAYNENRWWASSEGMRAVSSEALAYLYSLIFV